MSIALGDLELVDLRDAWQSESQQFTPWLAQPANLAKLSAAVGLELEYQDREVAVGPFYADILARDTATGSYVVIENQLERTDHSHLGQLIMYGAVLDASAIIWVAREFTGEHRKVLEWLNRHTDEGLDFYGVQIELWRIAGSLPAPRFNVVCRPAKVVGSTGTPSGDQKLSPVKKLQLEFWSALNECLVQTGKIPSVRTPRPQYWHEVSLGRTYFVISCVANVWDKWIGVRIYMNHQVADIALALLDPQREAIEAEIGVPLQWNPFPEKQDKIILASRPADLEQKQNWDEYLAWMTDMVLRFRGAFRERVINLDLTQPVGEEGFEQ